MISKWSSPNRIWAALIATALLSTTARSQEPSGATEHILLSEALTVRVMDPNHAQRYNQGPRFSTVAAVLQVSQNGREFLYCPAEHDVLRDGAGLFGEFDILTDGGPPGFSEAGVGDQFVKIGVGVLQKDAEKYDFYAPAKIVMRAQTTVVWKNDAATFHQTCQGVNGYSYDLEANIVVEGVRLRLQWKLTNTGKKAFATEHYVHNFFSLGGAPVGPGYRLAFSQPARSVIEQGSDRDGLSWTKSEISFDATIRNHVNILLSEPQPGGLSLAASQRESGLKITVDSTAPVIRTFVHATSRYLCPEQFVRISLQPCESYVWSRGYDFSASRESE